MNEAAERAKAARAHRMKELCEGKDGLFEVIDAVARDYQASLMATDVTDAASREAIYHRCRALMDIREVFRVAIVEGYAAERMLKALLERQGNKQRRVRE